MTEQDILNLIERDEWMMKVILIASALNLPDWIIGAGFVRNKIWDHLSGNERQTVDTRDVDLVYFDPNGNDEKADEKLSEKLKEETGIPWEVVNQYYAHKWNNLPPYTSTEDATAIGITLGRDNKLKLFAPYGIGDLVGFVVRPNPNFRDGFERVKERIIQKKWQEKWSKITLARSSDREA